MSTDTANTAFIVRALTEYLRRGHDATAEEDPLRGVYRTGDSRRTITISVDAKAYDQVCHDQFRNDRATKRAR